MFSSGARVRYFSFLVLGLALATFLTHTAVIFCLHADGSFGLKLADLGASASSILEAVNSCIDIPLSLGHTSIQMNPVHSVLSSFNFLSSLLSIVVFSVLSFNSFSLQTFISFYEETSQSFKTQAERGLQTTVLLQ